MSKSNKFPEPLALIFFLLIATSILAVFVPSGSYAREPSKANPNRMSVVPGSFALESELREQAERVTPDGEPLDVARTEAAASLPDGASYSALQDPPDLLDRVDILFTAVPKGLGAGGDIIFLVFIVGGVVAVLRATGAVDALIGSTMRGVGGKPILLVGGMMTLFAIGSSTIGMAEEYMPFVPLLTAMCLALKLDAIVALGIVYIGAGVGYGCAVINPFTVLPARSIAGITGGPEEMLVRGGMTVVMLAVGTHHLLGYARKVRENPSLSLVKDIDYSEGFEAPKDTKMTAPRLTILIVTAVAIAYFAYAVDAKGWYVEELGALFIGIAIFAAILTRLSAGEVSRSFCRGAAEMTTTALLIGVARGIEVILDATRVKDTVVHGIASALPSAESGGAWLSGVGMLGLQSVCNFFIPSGSGQAYVTMPIMAPVAEVTGVGRETAVMAFTLGDGLTNMIVPTNALLIGMLALAKIPYQQWLKFIVPLLVKLYVVAAIAVGVAASFSWGN